jgi:hypothetical protein
MFSLYKEINMKKLILILYSCILIAALLSGCAGKPASETKTSEAQAVEAQAAEDTKKAVENAFEVMETLTNKEWPADKLPSELPEYTEGEIANSGSSGEDFYVKIDKTEKSALTTYLAKLKELGWSVEEGRESIAIKGIYELRFTWQGENHLQMALYTSELGAWPADKLPPDIFPPDNCTFIGGVELIENVPGQAWYTTYTCDGIDTEGAEAYFEKLRVAGWSGDSQLVKDIEWNGKKYRADIEVYETDDNASSFTLNLMIAE